MEPSADDREDAAVVVVLTPRDYRRRSVIAIVGGILLLIASVLLFLFDDQRIQLPFGALFALIYGGYSLRQARRVGPQVVLTVDRNGISSGDGLYERTWAGVVMVWVGSQTGFRLPFVIQPVISIFTTSGLDFARRAQVRPSPVSTIPIGGRHRVPELCRRLGKITTAEVIDGTTTSRREAAAALASIRS